MGIQVHLCTRNSAGKLFDAVWCAALYKLMRKIFGLIVRNHAMPKLHAEPRELQLQQA
jgi:hypothetical protein